MATYKQVRLCGFGGQGVILAGVVLGYAGVMDGKWVAARGLTASRRAGVIAVRISSCPTFR